jgi:hypothetical protein
LQLKELAQLKRTRLKCGNSWVIKEEHVIRDGLTIAQERKKKLAFNGGSCHNHRQQQDHHHHQNHNPFHLLQQDMELNYQDEQQKTCSQGTGWSSRTEAHISRS